MGPRQDSARLVNSGGPKRKVGKSHRRAWLADRGPKGTVFIFSPEVAAYGGLGAEGEGEGWREGQTDTV